MREASEIRILVLDDEPFACKLLTHMLTRLGYAHVTACASGQAALEQLNRPDARPDVMLCDLNMPGMDGIEFMRKLVAYRYTGRLILVSGEEEGVLRAAQKLVKAHRLNVLGYLQKPVSPAALAALLGQYPLQSVAQSIAAGSNYGADELRAAIANGELVNYYQPKVATRTARVIGVETLVRWIHPVDGVVFPSEFIGLAEGHGLIDDLCSTVLTGALDQARVWQEAGVSMQVAINVSMDNLVSLDFPDFVAQRAARAGVAPQDVVLEVTESRLMADLRAPLEILTRLRLKRFNISIDDFGTGNSSLAQLRDMPFNELKIDRSFVHRACADERLRAMYAASLDLATKLEMGVVAEGVEDRDDWDFVRRTGCNLAQGYFIARPMPGDELAGWAAEWQTRVERERLTQQ